MKINQSKKSTRSIMAHPSFGGVLLKENDVELFIPSNWIFKNGRLKKYAQRAWKEHKANHSKTKHAI